MKKYITVNRADGDAKAQIQAWGISCKAQTIPCIIITPKGNLAEIACDNWVEIEDGILSVKKRQEIEPELKQLIIKYAALEIDLFVSEGRVENRLSPTHLWYTFIHVPVEYSPEVALSAFYILKNAATPEFQVRNTQ
jgi:hypothetical protein